jgi:hypothetical protein
MGYTGPRPGLLRRSVQVSETGTNVTLLSAFEDFVSRTLAAVPGLLPKLRYCARLRSPEGKYEHWGLVRVHGDSPAQRALQEAHSAVFLEVLRTPLRELARESSSGEFFRGNGEGHSTAANSQGKAMLPANLAGGSALHFYSVLDALAVLCRENASREAALPPPPPHQ